MVENYKKLIKFMKVLEGFENYRMNQGYGLRLKPFSYIKNYDSSITYNSGKLTIMTDKGIDYKCHNFLHSGRSRTPIVCNKLRVGFKSLLPTPYFNIQYSDNYIQLTSPDLFRYNLELSDLFEDGAHFQYTIIDDIPSIEVLKEAQEIFYLLLKNDIGFIGPIELPEIDYDEFLLWMRDQTSYVKEYWDFLDV